MGGSSMTRIYFAQKDEELNFNHKKEPELELVIYKGELVVTENKTYKEVTYGNKNHWK